MSGWSPIRKQSSGILTRFSHVCSTSNSKFLFTFLWLLVKIPWRRVACPRCAKANKEGSRCVTDGSQVEWGGGG